MGNTDGQWGASWIFKHCFSKHVLPSIVRSYETFLYYSFFVIFAVGTSGCLLASFLEDDGLVTVGTNKIPKYERSVDDQFSPSPRSVVSGSLPALFPLKRQLVVLGWGCWVSPPYLLVLRDGVMVTPGTACPPGCANVFRLLSLEDPRNTGTALSKLTNEDSCKELSFMLSVWLLLEKHISFCPPYTYHSGNVPVLSPEVWWELWRCI